jgi:hypothetical protein
MVPSSCDFTLGRKSGLVRVSVAVGPRQSGKPFELSVVSETMDKERKRKYARSSSQRHVSHLGRNPTQAVCLGRSNAANFGTCGKRVDSTNEHIKIVLILSSIPTTVVGIGRLETLQLGVDGSELLSQKKCLLLLREGLIHSRSDFRANFGNGKLLRQHMCDMLEMQRRKLGGEKCYKRNTVGISKLFLCGVIEGGTRSLGGGASGHTVCQMPDNIPG